MTAASPKAEKALGIEMQIRQLGAIIERFEQRYFTASDAGTPLSNIRISI